MTSPKLPAAASDLRHRAEAVLSAGSAGLPAPAASAEVLRLIHELQVHQIELELQNEELRRARDEAEESAARYAELYDFAPVGYVTLDGAGRILELNLACASLLGAPRTELLQRTLGAWLQAESKVVLQDFLSAVRREGRAACELELVRPGAASSDVHLDAVVEPTDKATGRCCRVAVTDVTERKANAQLREADRRKSEFLALLSHELRNPLTPISNAIQLLQRLPAGSEQAGRAMAIIERQTHHLTRLVDDLLDLTRISSGKIRLQPEVVDLRNLVQRAYEDHRMLFEQSGVELRLEESPFPVYVVADPVRLAQVVGNLLANAAKFTPPSGTASLAVSASGGRAEVQVRDTGVGIEPEHLERLFEPFAQVEDSLARTRGGLGLGLALARELMALQHGTVTGQSGGPGLGTTFTVALPLAPTPFPSPLVGTTSGEAHRSVVIIEDNPDSANSLADLLAIGGHRVEVALEGRAGVALVKACRPDLVFCDIGLPDLDGYEVAAQLRADPRLQATRLVALSGYARPEDEQRARRAGFDAHLAKPADLQEIGSLLRAGPRAR